MPTFPPSLSNLPLLYQGKTRDTYPAKTALIEGRQTQLLLIVVTNRLSTHNIVHTSLVPFKGQVLTALTVFWLTAVFNTAGLRHHLVAYGPRIYEYLPGNRSDYPKDLHLYAIIVRRLSIIPIEFIFRNYLTGSLYAAYKEFEKGDAPLPYGITLPRGLQKMSAFSEPLFTPTEKSEKDEPIDAAQTKATYATAYTLTRAAFSAVGGFLTQKGICMIDGKWEVGVDEDGIHYIADEVATPDSSRFAHMNDVHEGRDPRWLDKQLARDEAERIWLTQSRGPITFSPLVMSRLIDRYKEVTQELTGSDLRSLQQTYLS